MTDIMARAIPPWEAGGAQAGSLRLAKTPFEVSIPTGVLNLLTCRESSKFLEPQIDSDAAFKSSDWRVGKLDRNVKKPAAAPITAKVRAVPDLAFGKRAGMKHAESVTRKPKRLALALEVTAFQRNPCQRLFAAIAQVGSPVLCPRFGVLLTHGVDGTRVQSKFLRNIRWSGHSGQTHSANAYSISASVFGRRCNSSKRR